MSLDLAIRIATWLCLASMARSFFRLRRMSKRAEERYWQQADHSLWCGRLCGWLMAERAERLKNGDPVRPIPAEIIAEIEPGTAYRHADRFARQKEQGARIARAALKAKGVVS